MPEHWTETIETFAYEGRFAVPTLVAAGLLIACLLAFLAWRESRYAIRPGMVWLLLPLRLGAIALVLWALAGPTDIATKRRVSPKTVGIFVDGSASMTIKDLGDGGGQTLRWRDALDFANGESSGRRSLDRALGALEALKAAARMLAAGNEEGGSGAPAEEEARRLLARARAALATCRESLGQDSVAALLESEGPARMTAIRAALSGPIADGLELRPANRPGAPPRNETGDGLLPAIDDAGKALRILADQAYRSREEALISSAAVEDWAPAEDEDRIGKVIPWLERLEERWIAGLGGETRVNRFRFDREPVSLNENAWREQLRSSPTSSGDATDLSASLRAASREAAAGRLHAALFITDGAHNTGTDPRGIAAALAGIPTVVVPIGDSRLRRDLFLHHLEVPPSVIEKDLLAVETMVAAHDCAGEEITVELVMGDTVVDRRQLRIRGEMEDHRVTLKWPAQGVGPRDFAIRIAPVEGEFTEDNNTERIRVDVIDDEMRVFLADRLPRWEFRYLLNLFKRDPKVIADPVLFRPDHVYPGRRAPAGAPPRLPSTLDEWSRYRVVILGDLTQQQITPEQEELLSRYVVERGGNLVIIAGDEAMPARYRGGFGDLLPADFRPLPVDARQRGFGLFLTSEGMETPPTQLAETGPASARIWQEIGEQLPVYDLSPVSMPKPTAHVLIEAKLRNRPGGERRALLSWQYVGRGRVVYLAAPAAYKLRYREGDRHHYRFWGQMLRWIVARDLSGGSKTVRLTTDKTRYPAGSPVQARLRLSRMDGRPVGNADTELIARRDDRVVSRMMMEPDATVTGEYHAVLTGLPPGMITFEVRGDEVTDLLEEENYRGEVGGEIAVDPHESLELRNPLCNLPLLGSVAGAARGSLLSPGAAEEFLGHLDLEPTVEETEERTPLWASWRLLATIAFLLLAEWIGRKALGLV